MIDLQSCYDRQLGEIVVIMQESVRVKRLPIKSFTKLFPIIKHYIYTSYRISLSYYRGFNEK